MRVVAAPARAVVIRAYSRSTAKCSAAVPHSRECDADADDDYSRFPEFAIGASPSASAVADVSDAFCASAVRCMTPGMLPVVQREQ